VERPREQDALKDLVTSYALEAPSSSV